MHILHIYIHTYIHTHIYKYICTYACTHAIMEIMRPPVYHHNNFVATHALGHMM